MRTSLAPGLLLAAPALGDPNFLRSVVLLGHHDEDGALGWVLNGQPIAPVSRVLVDAKLVPSGVTLPEGGSYTRTVRIGGPVLPGSAWLLYKKGRERDEAPDFPGEIALAGDWAFSCAREAVEAVARGAGPTSFWLFLGYAGWGGNQLEGEIQAGAWLPADLDLDLLDLEPDAIWDAAYQRSVGVAPGAFTSTRHGSA